MGVQKSGWRLYQIIRNLASEELGIPLVVIQPGAPGLKKTRRVSLVLSKGYGMLIVSGN